MKSVFLARFFKGLLIFTLLIVIYFISLEIRLEFTHEKINHKEYVNNPITVTYVAPSKDLEIDENTENIKDDILPLLIEKPEQLEFVGSKVGSGQNVLEFNYRVSGFNAHLIEDILRKEYGMSELKFGCCGWESHLRGAIVITEKFNNKYGNLYDYNHISISMHSDETLIQDRIKWHEIPYFYVDVEVLNV